MSNILYHCSPINIKDFDFSEGVHFGGLCSALEAALRKGSDVIYVHRCSITPKSPTNSEDLGYKEKWNEQRHSMILLSHDVCFYKNKFEPDFRQSCFVVNENCVKMLSVFTVTAQEAEDAILELLY